MIPTLRGSASALRLDHESGFYDAAFHLTIATSEPGAAIYYTTNGSAPQPATGLRYSTAIPIATTTVLRAAAFDGARAVTDVAMRTFLFVPAILAQTGAQLPPVWGTHEGQPIPAHYTMSPAQTNPVALAAALKALPSLSIVTAPENLFSAETGIYLHPLERGADWERPVALELLPAPGAPGFHITCGLRIHGGMSRRPEESPKHSFRLVFKRKYGAGKLRFPVFGPDGTQAFDDLILRAGSNDSWLNSNGAQRGQATYLRDEWMRRSLAALGHPSARGTFVHLYLNGLYWGLYNLCERPGPGLLAGAGGKSADDYDLRKGGEIESGDAVAWERLMILANAGLGDERAFDELRRCLDVNAFMDFMLLNIFGGNTDWDRSANWYAIRPRTRDGKFVFLIWDAERTLADTTVNTLDGDEVESPMGLLQQLCANADFRRTFAARAEALLQDNGRLSPGSAAERFGVLVQATAPALGAEAARWGNYRATMHRYKTGPFVTCTAGEHWQSETDRLRTNYFAARRDAVREQLRERGLFPSTPPGN